MSHSDPMQNPTGGVRVRREGMQPALRDDLIERVLDHANVQRAWKQVKANGGAAGVDGRTIEAFPAFVRTQWSSNRRRDGAGVSRGHSSPTPPVMRGTW